MKYWEEYVISRMTLHEGKGVSQLNFYVLLGTPKEIWSYPNQTTLSSIPCYLKIVGQIPF